MLWLQDGRNILVDVLQEWCGTPAERTQRSQIEKKSLAGLKIGATLAVIGALVGEFVQPRTEGLGYLLVTARYQFKTDLVFVVLITLALIALSLYAIVALIERRVLRWQQVAK